MNRYKRFFEITLFKSPLTKGIRGECYENARKEYWERKNRGESIQYVVGEIKKGFEHVVDYQGNSSFLPMPFGLHHAWCLLDNKYIIDNTPFVIGIGNYWDLSTESAQEHFKNIIYIPFYFVNSNKLLNPLKYFPKE